MTNLAVLDIFLHNEQIGTLTQLPGDKNLLTFSHEYIDNSERATLSLSFEDTLGGLITDQEPTRTRLPPFFANLLPEGPMREYLAKQAKVSPEREFFLLAALGIDLPGALKVNPTNFSHPNPIKDDNLDGVISFKREGAILRFSLAGVQPKFSAVWDDEKGLTIPIDGVGGSWIVKLPSPIYDGVPENEYVMMELARRLGIDVPETALIPIDQIQGLPKGIARNASHAFIIKRFDRDQRGAGIHIEDFAQVFGVYPEKKYASANYRNIARVIWSTVGEKGIGEFIRRFVFNALIGNGDMHLKNWSLIYPNKRDAALAPAYDFVSTIPYLPEDGLALTFVDSKKFNSLTYEQFKRFATKAELPEALILDITWETVHAFKNLWKSIHDFHLDEPIINVINNHLKTIPLFK